MSNINSRLRRSGARGSVRDLSVQNTVTRPIPSVPVGTGRRFDLLSADWATTAEEACAKHTIAKTIMRIITFLTQHRGHRFPKLSESPGRRAPFALVLKVCPSA